MHALMIIIIAISLSMDAFSLSLAYGTLNINKKDTRLLAFIVGIYHFFMPLLGMLIGSLILNLLPISPNVIVFIVLLFIGIEMIGESRNPHTQKDMKIMSKRDLFLFAFAVSIDSFSVGIGLKSISNHVILSALTFSFSSFFFTYLGLVLGKKINNKIGTISTLCGGIVLIIIGIIALFT